MKGRAHGGFRFVLTASAVIVAAACPAAWAVERPVPSPNYPTIQSAIDACSDGDQVVIAPGTYSGSGNYDLNYGGRAITVRGTDPNDPNVVAATIIDPNEAGRGFIFNGGEDADSVIDGLTVTKGSGTHGGAINCWEWCSPTIRRCILISNRATSRGGAFNGHRSSAKLINCLMAWNWSSEYGGAVNSYLSDLTVQGCVIVGNTTRYYGGAVHYDWGSYSTITNCTIIGNSAELKGGGIYCHRAHATLTNSILWDNTAGEGHEIALYDASAIAVSYSVVQGGPNEVWGWPMTWGDGNVDADPLLTADGHLLGDSPCYNAGDPNTSTEGAETDIDAEPRPMSGRIEIGADEFIDTDADGLPNWWESKYFGSTTAADPNDDPDGDARLNLQEYSLSSNPQRDDKFYVDPNGDDAWDGRALAWDGQHGPKATIQAAIDAVDLLAPYGIAVMVAPGTYTGDGNRDIRLRGLPIAVLSTDPNDPNVVAATIIDCQGTPAEPHRGFVFDYGEGLDSVLAGLTITGGYAAGSGSDKDGGGIFCDQSRPTIIKCTITSSHAQSRGGGIWLGACSPAIADCTISQNQADIDGGGLSCTQSYPTITNCSIGDNEAAQNGGGIYCEQSDPTFEDCNVTGNQAGSTAGGIYCYQSDPNIHNCTISGNSANGSGGGVYCNESSPEITDCTIIGNSTAGTGGGIASHDCSPPITRCTVGGNSAAWAGGISCSDSYSMIVNCTISGNLSSHFGGGISCQNGDPIILSCIISGNSADTDGGGAYCAWGAPTMLNCTISGNSASAYGGGVYSKFGTPTLINCILWGDTAPEGDEIALRYSGGSLDLSYTDVQGGPNNVYVDSGSSLVWGGGNVDADPLFVDADGPDDDPNTWEDNDYHIKGKSPCKNTGDPNGDYADQTDIDGESRVMGPRVDMGADEKYKCGGGTEPLLAMMLLGGLTLIRRRR